MHCGHLTTFHLGHDKQGCPSNIGRLVNSDARHAIKIIVATCQAANPVLIHSTDDQRVVRKEPVPGSHDLSPVQSSLVRRQNENVQSKDARCLRPVPCQFSDFPPFTSELSDAVSLDNPASKSLRK